MFVCAQVRKLYFIIYDIFLKIVYLVKDDGDAKFTNFCVFPKSGPVGTTFVIDLSFRTVNGTGTGTFTFNIINPKNQSTGDLYWFEEKKPGVYPERLQFETISIPTCDPSKGKISYFSFN